MRGHGHGTVGSVGRGAALLVMAGLGLMPPGLAVSAGLADDEAMIAQCGNPFQNGDVGPWDYNNAEDRTNPQKIPIVEKFHFTRDVESLEHGSTGAYALGDLDYTLRAVPNHPRALNAVTRYDLEKGGIPPQFRSAECWLNRAMRFRPDDGTVYLIYANYKARKGQLDKALEGYLRAKDLQPQSIEIDYNMGLLYIKMGNYEKALEHARIAYAGNYPLQGLRHQLSAKGYQVEKAGASRPPGP